MRLSVRGKEDAGQGYGRRYVTVGMNARASCCSLALLLLTGASPRAADFFVAPTGRDTDPGTLEQPFATLQRAQEAVAPGDTVLVRGGMYRMQEAQIARRKGPYAYLTALDKSGTAEKPITYRAYQEEKPVFDCSRVAPEGLRVDAFYVSGLWLRLVGLEVSGVQVTAKDHTQSICFENDGSHNIYERLSMHDGQAIGIYSVRGSENLFLNCDSYNNWDYTSENGRGGNVDGFGCHPTSGSKGNVFRGCRAWFNSDDGYDCINSRESVTFENCWALYNGWSPKFENLADGNGFKAGGYGTLAAERLPKVIPRHTVRGCVAVGNKASGFYANHHPGGGDWFNNTAYRNGANFNMLCRLADNMTEVDGYGHVLRNNLSYKSRGLIVKFDATKSTAEANSFTLSLKLTDQDFVSLDEAEFFQPRQANGDLPKISTLRPVASSALVEAGVETGLSHHGARPTIGAFER